MKRCSWQNCYNGADPNITDDHGYSALKVFLLEYRNLYHPGIKQEFIDDKDKTLKALIEVNAKADGMDKHIIMLAELTRSRAAMILKNYFTPPDLTASNCSFFNRQEICSAPIKDTKDWNTINNDVTRNKEFQAMGPGYGF